MVVQLTTAQTESNRFLEAVLNEVLGTIYEPSKQEHKMANQGVKRQDYMDDTHPGEQMLPKHSLNFTSSNPVKTVTQIVECLDALGGTATPNRLLNATGLDDDVEKFFDLLREGRNSGLLSVPTGTNQVITRNVHAN